MRTMLLASVAAAGLAIVASSANAGSWVAVTPVANSTQTSSFGITDQNIVAGDWTDTSGIQHGFVGPIDGSNYTSFDDPDGTTQPRGINDKGWIAGFDSGTTATWERSPGGTLKPVKKAGVALTGVAQGLDKAGDFGADYIDPNTGATVPYSGLKYKFVTKFKLSLPNAGSALRGINDNGDVAGWFYDTNTGLQHGFVDVGGTTTQIDFPNATYTVMEGLNDKGYASGQFQDANGAIHGFIYHISTGKTKQLDIPNATLTQVWGISNHDVVAASSDVGSFVYCIKATTCPGAGAKVHMPQHVSGKFAPAQP